MTTKNSNSLFIGVREASEQYGLSEKTWWRLIWANKIRSYRPLRCRRVLLHRYDIQSYLSGKGVAGDARKSKNIRKGTVFVESKC